MKLLILTACEKVLQDPSSGPSLIATFQKLNAVVPSLAEVPTNAVIPKDWSIFALWEVDQRERGKLYQMGLELYWPNGELFFENKLPLEKEAEEYINFIVRMQGFPMGQSGKIRIVVWVEHQGRKVCDNVETSIHVTLASDEKAFAG